MGFWDDLTGKTASDAAKAAAADTYGKQNTAIQSLLGYGDQYANSFANLGQSYQPWINTGQTANTAVQDLIANPDSVRSLPGYQFQLGQGTDAINHAATATGNLFSGKTGKALQSYGQNLADTTYGSQLQRLLGVSNQGLGAQQAQNSTVGTGLTGQLGARQTAYGGQMNAAGTIGQGDIAAANAQAAGSQNLLNTGLKLGGMALGAFGGGGSLSSLFGGTPDYGQASNMNIGGYSMPVFGRS